MYKYKVTLSTSIHSDIIIDCDLVEIKRNRVIFLKYKEGGRSRINKILVAAFPLNKVFVKIIEE